MSALDTLHDEGWRGTITREANWWHAKFTRTLGANDRLSDAQGWHRSVSEEVAVSARTAASLEQQLRWALTAKVHG